MTEHVPRIERFTAPCSAPRLDVFIAEQLMISRTHAATLIAQGHVLVDGTHQKASYHPEDLETVEVTIPRSPQRDILGEAIPLVVSYEDEHVLVIDKPAGMVVHPAPGNWTGTLVNALKGRGVALGSVGGGEREGIVHRLDKETSGLLLVAKTDRAHRALGAAMAKRQIVRRYAVLTLGHLSEDRITIDRPIGRDPHDRKRMAIVAGGRTAKTVFQRLARFDSADLLRAHLHTGRTHQIRVHLASIGHPVMGDETYGGAGRRLVSLPPKRHFLHAAWLVFRHPVTEDLVELRSPLPVDLLASLRWVAGEMLERRALFGDADPLEYFGFYRVDG